MSKLNVIPSRFIIEAFYTNHYDAAEYLKPKKGDISPLDFYGYVEGGKILALTKLVFPTPFLLKTASTVVHKDYRRQGVGTKINDAIEEMAKERKIKKIVCHILTNNLPSLYLKLERDYLIEGLLRDHDEPGKHEYVLGKELQ